MLSPSEEAIPLTYEEELEEKERTLILDEQDLRFRLQTELSLATRTAKACIEELRITAARLRSTKKSQT